MHIAILGRQPAFGMVELERLYGHTAIHWFSDMAATITGEDFDFERLGGTQKAGRVISELRGDWKAVSKAVCEYYIHHWREHEGKLTLGISAYGFDHISSRDVQKVGLIIKSQLKKSGVSVRLIPNADPTLNTATSHHNKLGLSPNKVELLLVRNHHGTIIIAESIGAQNITALARRDQERPKRDAFVGMLPPKLARIMVNAATGLSLQQRILDPFCGTGVLLQEAELLKHTAYGSDLSEKMVDYTRQNLEWLARTHRTNTDFVVEHGDAMTHQWSGTINAVATETYLGQPFSAPPKPEKRDEVARLCNHIVKEFLSNIHSQLTPDTPLCIAVPSWRNTDGSFTHLPITQHVESLGYAPIALRHVRPEQLLYYREDQVVARELLLMTRA